MIEITKSNLINHLLENKEDLYSISNIKIKEYKQYVESEFDKWIWNRINRCNSTDKIETNFDSSSYAQKVYNENVKSYGQSDTDYGEFIRAFNKLAYRYFNDGDSPVYGPYSALIEFLKYPSTFSSSCSRKFEVGMDYFLFNCAKLFNNNYELMDCYSEGFGSLLYHCCYGISIFEMGHPDALVWCNDFITIIDQLVDEIKGMERCTISCDNFYKNILEYKYSEIYKWLEENVHETRFGEEWENDFVNINDSIYVTTKGYHQFNLKFEIGRNKSNYYETKCFEIDIEHDDEKKIELINKLTKICNYIQSDHKDKEDKNFDITLDEFFKELYLKGSHKCDFVKITNQNETLYEGRIVDLLDPNILNLKIKDFERNDLIEVN